MRRCIIPFLSVMLAPWSAQAWGPTGHRVAAEVAESRLSPEARKAVQELLEPGETLADASVWPDLHRKEVHGSGPWHYVNVPITGDHYEAAVCPAKGCVVSMLKEFEKTLGDTHADRAARQRALRFTVHLIEDLHQPLHVGDRGDRGGNDLQLRIGKRGTSMHRLWDEDLLKHAGDIPTVRAHVEKLITPELATTWNQEVIETWANESLALARRAYCDPTTKAPLQTGTTISDAYVTQFTPEAERRVAQAATRIAATLNAILGRPRQDAAAKPATVPVSAATPKPHGS